MHCYVSFLLKQAATIVSHFRDPYWVLWVLEVVWVGRFTSCCCIALPQHFQMNSTNRLCSRSSNKLSIPVLGLTFAYSPTGFSRLWWTKRINALVCRATVRREEHCGTVWCALLLARRPTLSFNICSCHTLEQGAPHWASTAKGESPVKSSKVRTYPLFTNHD